MTLEDGARTIVDQCLNIQEGEEVLVLNDENDEDLLEALLKVVRQTTSHHDYLTYPEPDNHGEEPPNRISDTMKNSDVVIAPTKKSLSHTQARINACEAGARVATLPGINKEIWNTSLQADYSKVKELSEKVYSLLEETSEVRIKTPSGTDLSFEINIDYYHTDTGIIHEPGDFGNLPAGEADGGVVNANGKLVIDHFPFSPSGTEVIIEDNKAVKIKNDGGSSDLREAFSNVQNARNIAEFGFGTNPKATLIGKVLQDEKVLGTVHIAFGDNTSYIDSGSRRKECDIHWDTVCEKPTVWFDDKKVLDKGDTVFL